MKKFLALLLTAVMLVSVVVGCNGGDASGAETTNTDVVDTDTTCADTTDADTTVADTTVADTTVAGTTGADTTKAETTKAETTKVETTEAETTEAETTTPETTEEPIVATGYTLSEEIMFVNHEPNGRSGHLGHALIEYAPNKILAFYSNTDGQLRSGHNCKGWVEYKRSEDGGQTWSDPVVLQYSKDQFNANTSYIAAQEAVLTEDGKIILFCYRSVTETTGYGPNMIPTYLISEDDGVTWSEAKELGNLPGKIFDAVVKDGDIYVIMRVDYNMTTYHDGDPSHVMYKSEDNGKTFVKSGDVVYERGKFYYANMVVSPEGKLVIYLYTDTNETILYRYETDDGVTFKFAGTPVFAKKIRNPQVIYLNGLYFMHGRSGNDGPYFVLYTSKDGINWDEGMYIREVSAGFTGSCYYSNNIVVGGNRILIQASDNYEAARTNIKHWWIDLIIE